jgi:hypothetical protein
LLSNLEVRESVGERHASIVLFLAADPVLVAAMREQQKHGRYWWIRKSKSPGAGEIKVGL